MTTAGDNTPISVAQLNRQAKFILEQHFPALLVQGEISNLARPRSGHIYFTLKDADAQVRCAFFRGQAARQRHPIQEGDAVLVRGRLSLYEGRGDYQMIVSGVMPAGAGALQVEFEALKRRLEAEGLFDPARKQPLPTAVSRLGVITSATGAALQDVLQVLQRRDPRMEVRVYSCLLQGREAAADIRRALRYAITDNAVDALLLTRGGGSAEDLWCFNDEALARDLAACPLPIVSAVGHETDFTIADFVADVRAPTPSAGAELLSQDQQVWRQQFRRLDQQLRLVFNRYLAGQRQRIDHLYQRLRHPSERIREQQQRLDERSTRLERAMLVRLQHQRQQQNALQRRLQAASPATRLHYQHTALNRLRERLPGVMQRWLQGYRGRLEQQAHALHLASPLATLQRGYSITLDEQQRVIRSITQVAPGQTLEIRVADGRISGRVDSTEKAARGD